MTRHKLPQRKPLTLYSHHLRVSPFLEFTASEETQVGSYAGRAVAYSWGEDPEASYWALRRTAIMFDTPEHPIEIRGSDATMLLNRVLVRDVPSLRVGRAAYGIACYEDGGVLMDGILLRLEADLYWYVQADGEFVSWLRAHAVGMDVAISEPESQVLQVQGPHSMKVLQAACDGDAPDPFAYFGIARVTIGGQPLLISRTGWSGELGWEFYTHQDTDAAALWHHILQAGAEFGLQGADLMGLQVRRVEAGILNNLSDIDPGMNPFQAGLGKFVDLDKADFIGKKALKDADRNQMLWGVRCDSAMPATGSPVLLNGMEVGHVTVGVWSPLLNCGIGYVRFFSNMGLEGKRIQLADEEGDLHDASVVQLPFYDQQKRIPRGLDTQIP